MSVYPRIGGKLIRPTMGMMKAASGLFRLHGKVGELLPLERVLCTAFHKEPDRVPVTHFLLGAARRLTGISYERFSRDPEMAADAYIAANEILGGDVLYTVIDLSVEAADFGQEMVYPQYSTAHPEYGNPLIASPGDYERLEVFDPRKSPRMGMGIELGRILSKKAGIRYPVMGFVFGPLGVLAMMRGAQRLFVDCLKYPERVKVALETITEVLVDYVRAQCDTGVDAVMLDTLFGSQSGISRELWVKMEGVYAKRIADEIRRCGALVALHNCGTGPYLDLQLEYMEPLIVSLADVPDDCRDLADTKAKYGERVALAGFIPTDSLCSESPARIMEKAREQIRVMAPGGGFVLAPACEYPPNLDLANALAVVRAAQLYGRYPIK
ncbi:MAG: uroporphyrinogen decarboxylase family protein [Actinomycetota bacterium]|nr:uroporphyrinogen decarboxylase family protein [Actinomycetota bacterium]MDD5665724.1 uroporphyrinogen decarboxylase family protein [Actinomycetota bacterium]